MTGGPARRLGRIRLLVSCPVTTYDPVIDRYPEPLASDGVRRDAVHEELAMPCTGAEAEQAETRPCPLALHC